MRRYTFYLSVALLAFGIGSFVVFNFYWKTESTPIASLTISEVKIETAKPTPTFGEENKEIPKQKVKFTCNNKVLSAVLKDLKKEGYFSEELIYQSEERNLSNCNDILLIEKSVDLNNDGKKESIVRGQNGFMCGATGNCSIWIYENIGKKYTKLLEANGEALVIKKNLTNGFRDNSIKHRMGCCSFYQSTYEFRNGKYKENKCLYIDYGTTGIKTTRTCLEDEREIQEDLRKSKKAIKITKAS